MAESDSSSEGLNSRMKGLRHMSHRVASRWLRLALAQFRLESIEKLRKDFLQLVGNTPRATTPALANHLAEGVRTYGQYFNDLIFTRLMDFLKEQEWKKNLTKEEKDHWETRIRKSSWLLYIELSLPLKEPDNYYSPETRFRQFEADRDKWLRRVQSVARGAWKDLREFIEWFERAREEPVALNMPTRTIQDMSGFSVQVVMPEDPSEYLTKGVEVFQAALPIYKSRAAKVLPWLLQHKLPFILSPDSGLDEAGRYEGRHITIGLWSIANHPVAQMVKTIAHEMGHHLHKAMGRDARIYWDAAIRGDYGPLDLRKLLDAWPESIKDTYDLEKHFRKTDPILSLQISVAFGGYPPNRRDPLSTREQVEAMVASGEGVIVPKTPITGYAGKNSEEAFCEALGLLIAYGPQTVHPQVREWLMTTVPAIKVASMRTVVESRRQGDHACPKRCPATSGIMERVHEKLPTPSVCLGQVVSPAHQWFGRWFSTLPPKSRVATKALARKGNKYHTSFYGHDAGSWEAVNGFILGFRGIGYNWEMVPSMSSKNEWRTYSVEGPTEHHSGFRKALREIAHQ